MAIEPDLDGVRRVAPDLHEGRTEVPVEQEEVVVASSPSP
jgi:hypothetical protein